MSIGTGHMVCFCRAANAGCSTPFKNIQNDEGVISSESLKKDAEFKVMLEVGWQVEVTWPTLPEFGQRGLVLYINRPPQPKHSNMEMWSTSDAVSPYFWVGDVADKALANAVVKHEQKDGFKIPYISNSGDLKPGCIVALEKATASSSKRAVSVESGPEPKMPRK